MKTIKIRFIHEMDKYYIQRRGWFGWKDITYTIDMGYTSDTKESLLDEVLEKYYQTDKRFVQVIEHSTIKIY